MLRKHTHDIFSINITQSTSKTKDTIKITLEKHFCSYLHHHFWIKLQNNEQFLCSCQKSNHNAVVSWQICAMLCSQHDYSNVYITLSSIAFDSQTACLLRAFVRQYCNATPAFASNILKVATLFRPILHYPPILLSRQMQWALSFAYFERFE